VVPSPVLSDVSFGCNENADVGAPLASPRREDEFIRGADTTPRRKSSRWVDPDKKEWVREPRSSSTPRKRVISDEHWKKKQKRSPRSQQCPSKPEAGQQARQEVWQEKCPSETPRHTSSRREREERRQRRKNARSSAGSGMIHVESIETEPDPSPPLQRTHSGKQERVVQSDVDSGVDDDLPGRLQSKVSPVQSVKEHRRSLRRFPEPDEKPRGRSQYAEMLDKSPKIAPRSFNEATGSIRSRKSGIVNQAKEMFSRTDPVQSTSQRLPSIEAWLDEQPDPFVDANPEPVAIPAPLKTRSNRQKVNVSPKIVEDPNKIWNYVESEDLKLGPITSTTRRRRRRSRRSQDAMDTGSPESVEAARAAETTPIASPRSQDNDPGRNGASSGALKRRGARALRAKTGSSPPKTGYS
jgi:hypothetical protein